MIRLIKRDIVKAIAIKAGLTQTQAQRALDATKEIIMNAVSRGEPVRLLNFGIFERRTTSRKEWTNPNTGKAYTPAKYHVKFTAGEEFKRRVRNE